MSKGGGLFSSGNSECSLIDDRFDVRSAKQNFGRIVAASTLGGIAGGALAARIGSSVGVDSMLPALCLLHLVCAMIAKVLASRAKQHLRPSAEPGQRKPVSGLAVVTTVPYVRNLAILVLFSTIGAGLLDYVFKVRVSLAHPNPGELVRFFAFFYTAAGVATFLVQVILSRIAVEKFGIAGTVGSLPLTVAFGSVGGLLLPGVPAASVIRGGEAVLRSSLFKSGYEILYAAVPRRERRATKAILDVGVERLGDLLAAVVLAAIIFLLPDQSTAVTLALAAIFGFSGFWISQKLRRGYVDALEKSLVSQTMVGQISRIRASVLTLADSIRPVSAGQRQAQAVENRRLTIRDPIVKSIQELRSTNVESIRQLLARPIEPVLTAHVLALLAWDDVSPAAVDALKRIGPRITGQLLDVLLDPAQEFAIRRRIPGVLSEFHSQRAVDGLLQALSDNRFEVRFHSGRALMQIQNLDSGTEVRRDVIMTAVERELAISLEESHHDGLIDGTNQERHQAIVLDHVFRLLALVVPREPLRIAYQGLRSGNDHLKGTSVEYLENILPPRVSRQIRDFFEGNAASATLAN